MLFQENEPINQINYFIIASIKFSADKFSDQSGGRGGQPQQQESSMKTIKLNSSDDLYAEIRDLNFYAVGPLLNRKAKHIREAFEVKRIPV